MLKRLIIIPVLVLTFFVLQTQTAFACGGLVAPNGSIRLGRATTLVEWHNGIEHYMTSFTYQGDVANLGWIVPLPAVPLKIEEGGAWTLQRLFRETHPVQFDNSLQFAATASSAGSAQVLQQVAIEALDITVIRGSGREVINWATSNGFTLDSDTTTHLLTYAKGSPIFMAAKYNTAAAKARHQVEGEGWPVLITMKTAHPWIPFEVLALDGQQVQADLYLLTDMPVNTSNANATIGQSAVGSYIPGAPGFKFAFQEKMTPTLYHDLSTDRNMSWVRPDSWLTYLSLDAPDTQVRYDMGIAPNGVIKLAPSGTPPMAVVDGQKPQTGPLASVRMPLGTPQVVLSVLAALLFSTAVCLVFWRGRRRTQAKQ